MQFPQEHSFCKYTCKKGALTSSWAKTNSSRGETGFVCWRWISYFHRIYPSQRHNLPPSLEIMIYLFYNSTYSKSIIFSSCNGTSLQIKEDFIFNFGWTGSLLLARLMWHYPFPFKRWKFVKRNFLLWRHWKFPTHILFQLCKQIFLTSFSWF